jgi:hypothetical protein
LNGFGRHHFEPSVAMERLEPLERLDPVKSEAMERLERLERLNCLLVPSLLAAIPKSHSSQLLGVEL